MSVSPGVFAVEPFSDTAERLQLWSALADLYLDTDVRPGLALNALSLLASGFDEAQWDWIFQHEVTPAVYHNMQCVAGEWAGFDEAWLRERILAHKTKTLAMTDAQRQRRYRTQGLADAEWQACKAFAHLLRSIPAENRWDIARCFNAFGWTYFDGENATASHQDHVAQAPDFARARLGDAERIFSALRTRQS
jgi:hypothetical protein